MCKACVHVCYMCACECVNMCVHCIWCGVYMCVVLQMGQFSAILSISCTHPDRSHPATDAAFPVVTERTGIIPALPSHSSHLWPQIS